jgi:hypothetical protein
VDICEGNAKGVRHLWAPTTKDHALVTELANLVAPVTTLNSISGASLDASRSPAARSSRANEPLFLRDKSDQAPVPCASPTAVCAA